MAGLLLSMMADSIFISLFVKHLIFCHCTYVEVLIYFSARPSFSIRVLVLCGSAQHVFRKPWGTLEYEWDFSVPFTHCIKHPLMRERLFTDCQVDCSSLGFHQFRMLHGHDESMI